MPGIYSNRYYLNLVAAKCKLTDFLVDILVECNYDHLHNCFSPSCTGGFRSGISETVPNTATRTDTIAAAPIRENPALRSRSSTKVGPPKPYTLHTVTRRHISLKIQMSTLK